MSPITLHYSNYCPYCNTHALVSQFYCSGNEQSLGLQYYCVPLQVFEHHEYTGMTQFVVTDAVCEFDVPVCGNMLTVADGNNARSKLPWEHSLMCTVNKYYIALMHCRPSLKVYGPITYGFIHRSGVFDIR